MTPKSSSTDSSAILNLSSVLELSSSDFNHSKKGCVISSGVFSTSSATESDSLGSWGLNENNDPSIPGAIHLLSILGTLPPAPVITPFPKLEITVPPYIPERILVISRVNWAPTESDSAILGK